MNQNLVLGGVGLILTAMCVAGAAFSQDHADQLPDAPAKTLVVATCTACHDATEISTRKMTADKWDTMVGKMIDLGATVGDKERPIIVAYLGQYFSPDSPKPAAATNAPTQP